MPTQTETCKETVRTDTWGRSYSCGNTVKGEYREKKVCGLHLRMYKERDQRDLARQERMNKEDIARARARRACDKLAALGFQGTVEWSSGDVVFPIEDMERMLEKLSG